MTGESTHTASKEKMVPCAPAVNYRLKSEISIMLRCQVVSYVQPITQHYKSRTIRNAPMQS